jgi:hypothetical protein
VVLVVVFVSGIARVAYGREKVLAADLESYRAKDPRIEIREVEADDRSPYLIHLTASVENPGDATILRSWACTVTRSNGEVVLGRLTREDWICQSYEAGTDGHSRAVDHAHAPVRSGGTASAYLSFEFERSLIELQLDAQTQFQVSCRTIKQVRVEGSAATELKRSTRPPELDDTRAIERSLGVSPDPERTHKDRLEMARTKFAVLADAGATGDANARKSLFHVGIQMLQLSRVCNGMTMEYVKDFDRFREGCVRGGIREKGYVGDH